MASTDNNDSDNKHMWIANDNIALAITHEQETKKKGERESEGMNFKWVHTVI